CSGGTAVGPLSKPDVSRSRGRNRPSGRAQTRSWRTLLGELARRRVRSPVLAFTSRLAGDETLSRLCQGTWTLDRALDRQPWHGTFLWLVSNQQRSTVRRYRTLDRRAANSANCPASQPSVRLDLYPPGP